MLWGTRDWGPYQCQGRMHLLMLGILTDPVHALVLAHSALQGIPQGLGSKPVHHRLQCRGLGLRNGRLSSLFFSIFSISEAVVKSVCSF